MAHDCPHPLCETRVAFPKVLCSDHQRGTPDELVSALYYAHRDHGAASGVTAEAERAVRTWWREKLGA